MVPPIPPQLAAADCLRCAGLGLLAAFLRCLLPLRGRAVCFCADFFCAGLCMVLLQGYAAGCSAAGAWRWYLLAGAVCGAAAGEAAFLRIRRKAAGAAAGLAQPLRRMLQTWTAPFQDRRRMRKLRRKAQKKPGKAAQYPKKRLQNPVIVLYNSNVSTAPFTGNDQK